MNINVKENEKNKDNSNRNKNLEKNNSFFCKLISEPDYINLIKDYDPIQFNSIILCYLNFYDYNNFLIYIEKLYTENLEVLYEILIIYFLHFFKPLEQKLVFLLNLLVI